ncbi:YceD family protein [Herbinix luporum]|jgi:uncharacterized protein|uniref:DUF177 domain-containing protein n=1 Tax=Herbinix luporum TaxID=1679721 RepID=A0A0K8J6C4_9FIRM|nr:DUF177 domain-containing protein [Herbinix luporum]MDI9489430.1 DUF177 domain-containing protein [Bacillota bacterium]CUH93191.1 hypothetical protein SD1D_1646 [Herbinix luporum]HHT57956.1 DUF177 domain-containing protein [Herbinix luporum]
MLISLSEIINTKGKVEHILAPIEMEKFIYDGEAYEFARKDRVDLTITNLGKKKVLIEGSTKLSLIIFCSRCLKELEYPMDISVSKEIDLNLTEDDRVKELDEANYITGYNLDVDILIKDEIIIGFPMKVLCSEQCKGICMHCGTNLNEKSCDCDNTVLDPRMSAILDIFNNFKEV